MKRFKNILAIALVLVLSLSLLAGCGKAGDVAEPDAFASAAEPAVKTEAPAPAPVDTPEPAAAETAPAEIKVTAPSFGGGNGGYYITYMIESLEDDIQNLCPIRLDGVSQLPAYRETFAYDAENPTQPLFDVDDKLMDGLEANAVKLYSMIEGEDMADVELKPNEYFYTSKESPAFMCTYRGLQVNVMPHAITLLFDLPDVRYADTEGIEKLLKEDKTLSAACEFAGISDPVVLFGKMCSTELNNFTIYQRSDDYVQEIANIGLYSLWLQTGTTSDMIVVGIRLPEAVEKAEHYDIVPYEKALEQACEEYGFEPEDAVRYAIGYYNNLTPGYYIPCYRIVVDIENVFMELRGLDQSVYNEYGEVLVPAIVL